MTLEKMPIAHPRRSGPNAMLSRASASGITMAAPVPCSTRPAISQPTVGASAHSAEAAAKTSKPTAYTRRRPNRSPSVDAAIMNTEMAST